MAAPTKLSQLTLHGAPSSRPAGGTSGVSTDPTSGQIQLQQAVLPPPSRKVPQRTYAQIRGLANSSLAGSDSTVEQPGEIVVNFPAMPDVIDFTRTANYNNVAASSPGLADGLHIYTGTSPLTLELSFTLHSYDVDFTAQDGPVALLAIAARLHALTLPIWQKNTGSLILTAASAIELPKANGSFGSEQALRALGNPANPFQPIGTYYPMACQLRIITAAWTRGTITTDYGVFCRGFVTKATARLKGPWLYGGPNLQNLPSSAEYAITFVHQPGFSNDQANPLQNIQTMAQDVYQRFYNQDQLSKLASYTQTAQDAGGATDAQATYHGLQ